MKQCSKCKENPAENGQRWCRSCQTVYMRGWRSFYGAQEKTEEEKQKAVARAKAGHAQRRGLIKVSPCSVCGSVKGIEKHHPDYTKPFEVVWLCRRHHRALHPKEKAGPSTQLTMLRRRLRTFVKKQKKS